MKEPEGETLFQSDPKIGSKSKRREIPYSFMDPPDYFLFGSSFYLEKTEIY